MGRETITCHSCCANITEKTHQCLGDSFPKLRGGKDEKPPFPNSMGAKSPCEDEQTKKNPPKISAEWPYQNP